MKTQLKHYFISYFQKVEAEEAEEEIEDKPVKKGPDFKDIRELIDNVQIDEKPLEIGDIIFNLMTAINDQSEEHLSTYLPMFVDDMVAAKMTTVSITRGVGRFMQEMSDLATDVPRLPHIFFHSFIKPLIEKQRLDLKTIVWAYENQDDLFAFGGHFKIFAMLL